MCGCLSVASGSTQCSTSSTSPSTAPACPWSRSPTAVSIIEESTALECTKKSKLHVVWIAKDHRGSETSVNDSRVQYAVRVQMRHPPLEFIAICDPKRQVIQSNPLLIECAGPSGAATHRTGMWNSTEPIRRTAGSERTDVNIGAAYHAD